jgi:hypothetical protein
MQKKESQPLGERPQKRSKPIRVVNDMGVMSVVGECPSCCRGDRSLVIVDFVPNYFSSISSTVFMKCLTCDTTYESQVSTLAER